MNAVFVGTVCVLKLLGSFVEGDKRCACGTYVGGEKCIQSFGGKTEGERQLGRCGRRWEDNYEMDIEEMEWGWSRFIWLRIRTSGGFL